MSNTPSGQSTPLLSDDDRTYAEIIEAGLKRCPRCNGSPTFEDDSIYCGACGEWTGEGHDTHEAIKSWNYQPLVDSLHARIAELEKQLEMAGKRLIDCKVAVENIRMEHRISDAAAGEIAVTLNRWRTAYEAELATLRETLRFASTYKGIEGRPCPLCKYEDGKFIELCQMHKDMGELEARVAELEPVPFGEYEDGEGDTLIVDDNQDAEGCTYFAIKYEGVKMSCRLLPGWQLVRLRTPVQDAAS